MGDTLWVEPVIRYFAKRVKEVVVVTHHMELFDNYPLSNVRFQYRLKKREKIRLFLENLFAIKKYFINLNGAYENKPKQHILQSYINYANISIPFSKPQLYLSEVEKKELIFDGKYVVLHLENSLGKNYRNIYGVDWNYICNFIKSKGYKVIQVGKTDKKIDHSIYFPTHSLRSLISLINQAAFFIGADSGPSHIASSLNIPALLFFGSVNPWYRHFPDSFNGLILQQFCEFAGCYHETISTSGQTCKLVGDDGIPKCSLHSNEYVIQKIEALMA